MKIMLDTNVILDIVEKREPYFSYSYIIDMLKVVSSVDTKAVDIQEAIRLNFSDFEDAVIAATASREGASYIITRNTSDYNKSPVPAITPADFLKKILHLRRLILLQVSQFTHAMRKKNLPRS